MNKRNDDDRNNAITAHLLVSVCHSAPILLIAHPDPALRSIADLAGRPFLLADASINATREYEPSFGDYVSLLKPRVMALVIFTAACAMVAAPGSLHPFLAFTGILCIAVAAGAAGAEGSNPYVVHGARVMALFGDSITTDHISPAGSIKESSPAGQWLRQHGVQKADFNSYGARRGNHDVMVRGTFANVRIKNLMIPPTADGSREEGGVTVFQNEGALQGEKMFIFDAAMQYMAQKTPTVIFAGEEYGTGSSRDWAAKGTQLLGIKAVVARSFERIHRSNLVGMGVLPLQFKAGDSWETLGLTGNEVIDVLPDPANIPPGCRFHPRCPVMLPECTSVTLPILGVESGHHAACVRAG